MDEDFRWFREHHVENMDRMFAAVSDLYADHWHDFFHFALFPPDGEDWRPAFERTHRRFLEALRVPAGGKAVDLACGRGGFADWLAANCDAEVLGVDISAAQLERARRHRRDNLRFARHDVMRIDELGETFDAVSFMDADCYLPDKGAAIAAIGRILKPGGRFLLLAWCKQDGLNGLQEELVLEPFMRFWGVPGLETPDGYRRHLAAAGLKLIDAEDLNDRIKDHLEFGYGQAIAAVQSSSLADAARYLADSDVGEVGLSLIKNQFHAALYIKAAFDAGFLRYSWFVAERADRNGEI